jgi:Ca2+-dependent lipid-binding protein
MDVKSSASPITGSGLYTTWEGAMPKDGPKRKPVPPSSKTQNSGSIRKSASLEPNASPAKGLFEPGTAVQKEATRIPVPLHPESSPARALFNTGSTIASNPTSTSTRLDAETSPAKHLLDSQVTEDSSTDSFSTPTTSTPTFETQKESSILPSPANEYVPHAVEPTKYGQAYSERNPPPNIQTFREEQEKQHEASQKYFKRETEDKVKEHEPQIASTDTREVKSDATDDVPIGAEKSNVLFQPTPAVNFNQVFETVQSDAIRAAYVVLGSIIVLDWLFIGGGIKGLLKSLFPAAGVSGAVYLVLSSVGKTAAKSGLSREAAKTEKLAYVPESVEWMNTLVETLWHTLQQDFFDNIASIINESIKPYIPDSVPATVKITKLSHGTQSVRVLSVRSLPDSEFGDLVPTHGLDKSGSVEQQQAREKAVQREEGGVFYNLEISIAYHEAPFKSRQEHMHVDVLAMLGPIPLPVFVQVKEFVATIRIRLQMHPDLPFLKNLTFALTENPKVNTCVSFGAPWALDLLNLPIIDSVLASQIDAAASGFVQPKSMSLDMTVYVGGSDQKVDTEAIGVLFVKIHRARQLARQDNRGPGADPYLTIAFSKYEKPMYATRIIKGDRNPVWEETAIIMIRAEHVKRNEKVLLRLWDSDTTGSDDVSGVCEFPLQELILRANQMEKREDQLQGDVAGTDAEGVLEWEIGYFPRAEYQAALRTNAKDPQDRHGDKVEITDEEKTQDAMNTVPDPNLPSGILGLTIHQCINVDVNNPNKKSMGHIRVRDQNSDGEDASSDEEISIGYIPSLYCTADINDSLVYRTRVKNITNSPTFNSSTETYIRDWRLATLTLACWDTRKKIDDCLVGAVSLKVSDIFHASSSVVKFYDLKGGEGTGRIRVSMIFRSMKMKLDYSLLGFSVGSFVFTSPIICTGTMHSSKLRIRVSGSQRLIKENEKSSSSTDSEKRVTYTLTRPNNVLPVQHRYLSPLVLEFRSGSLPITDKLPGTAALTKKSKHYAVTWLFRLVDNEECNFELPVYETNNPDRLIQNVVSESDETME